MSPAISARGESLWRTLALPFVLLCGIWYVRENVLTQIPDAGRSDFAGYYNASRNVLHGQSPYLVDVYIYPPALSFLLAPIAPLDYVTARRIWFVLSHLCLLLSAWLLWQYFERDVGAGCLIALVWAGGGAAAEDLGLGQMGPLLTLLLTCFYMQRGVRQ